MSDNSSSAKSTPASVSTETTAVPARTEQDKLPEKRPVPDPTRYGDWEKNGRCIDF
ncbi:DUF1674 domain-containing protein [Rhodanobacter sp. Col0626]|uniref:DUF1674 domain-containing protein n=1 Tax=Rhodanobacter sp. Col0626 TaxID=3415679 RepID=UPI003CFAE8F3